jgi:hypothetical protein
MFHLIKSIMPKEEKFFDLFEAHAAKAQEAALSLRTIVEGGKVRCRTTAPGSRSRKRGRRTSPTR